MTEKERKDDLKKRLYRYRDLKAERGDIAAAYHALADPKNANIDGMPKSPGTGDPLISITEQRRQLVKKYHDKLEEIDAALLMVENMIEGLEPTARRIMRCRYIDGLPWEKVCVAVGYSWSQTHDYHAKALDALLAAEAEKEAAANV